jgi:cytidylate kinase
MKRISRNSLAMKSSIRQQDTDPDRPGRFRGATRARLTVASRRVDQLSFESAFSTARLCGPVDQESGAAMAIVTISRGSYSYGRWIAGSVAERLGYECASRDVLLAASEEFKIPEVQLVRALHDAPSVLERITHGRERYIAFIQQAFLEYVQRDNVVYHGLAGHFFLAGVSHVLKVRITADIQDRVSHEMEQEGIPEAEALRIIKKDDQERRRWSLALYGIDTFDPSLYDLVIHIRKMTEEDAVDLICRTVSLPQFETTPESLGALEELVLAARRKSAAFGK